MDACLKKNGVDKRRVGGSGCGARKERKLCGSGQCVFFKAGGGCDFAFLFWASLRQDLFGGMKGVSWRLLVL